MGSGSSKKTAPNAPCTCTTFSSNLSQTPNVASAQNPTHSLESNQNTIHVSSRESYKPNDDYHQVPDIPVVKKGPEKKLPPREEQDFTPIDQPHLETDREETTVTTQTNANALKPVHVPVTLPGYRPPAPQELSIDEIRPPIPWYQPDPEEDEFNWKEIEKDLQEFDEGKVIPVNLASRGKQRNSAITPRSVLLNSTLNLGRLSNTPITTPSGRKISFMNQEKTRSYLSSRQGDSVMSLAAVSVHGIPRRLPPKKGTLSFKKIDEQARSTTKEHHQTFAALVDYLRQPIRFHKLSELMIARGLIVWLASQKISKSLGANLDIGTPRGVLQLLAHGTITYSAAYAVLCREAGLPCVIIDGIARNMDLEASRNEPEYTTDTWTAVFVEGDWQIVHPYWICKGHHGLGGSLDDWIDREVENEGRKREDVIRQLKLVVQNFINEDYFMPTPEVFVHSNYADNKKWQLLPTEYIVQSIEDFLDMPLLFPAFFRFGLKLLTKPSCVLYSEKGKVKIWFLEEMGNAHKLALTYELHLMETQCANYHVLKPNMNRLVIHCRHNELFYFEIRFPIEGVFRLDIQGGFHKAHALRLCQFKLICESRMEKFKYVPYDPEDMMWGPGPLCSEHGLDLPSKPTGIVKIFPQPTTHPPHMTQLSSPVDPAPTYKQRQFIFQKHPDRSKFFEYSVDIIGHLPDDKSSAVTPLDDTGQLVDRKKRKNANDDLERPDYSFCVRCFTTRSKKQLIITVDVPHEGDFALILYAVPFSLKEDGLTKEYGEEVPICAYLLRTFDEAGRENAHQKIARAELQAVMRKAKAEDVFKAVEKCHRVKIDAHDDELAAGTTRAEFLQMRKEIFDAIHRRNYRVLNETLMKLSKYRHKGALVEEIRRLFTLRNQVKRLLVFPTYVPELRRAGDELIYVTDPSPEIHITMGALCLLLELPDRAIESWRFITQQLSNESIYKKMYLIAEMMPSKNAQRKIMTLLAEFNFNKVKEKSVAAAKFYIWVQKVMGIFQDIDFDLPGEGKKLEEEDDDQGEDVELTATKHVRFKPPNKDKNEVNVLKVEDM